MIVLVFLLAVLILIVLPLLFLKLYKSPKFEEIYENLGELSVDSKNEKGKTARQLIDEYNQKLSEIEKAKRMIETRKRELEQDENLLGKVG